MKIKKIFSAFLATTLMCSTLVAYAHDFNTRTPSITYNVGDKIATEEELSDLAGLDFNANYDFYPVSISVKDLGKVYVTSKTDHQVISDITFTLKTTNFSLFNEDESEMYSDGVTPDVGGTWSLANDNVNIGYFNMYWKPALSSVTGLKSQNMYPGSKTTIDNASLDFTVVLALPAGTNLTLNNSDLSSIINYYDVTTTETVGVSATITNDSLVFGKTVDPDPKPTVTPWEVTITKDTENAKGYIWKVDTAKGDGNLTKFDVTFKDGEANELTRSIIASDKGGALDWNAATSFYVGLYTTRTGVTADWDVASKDGDTVIPATIK